MIKPFAALFLAMTILNCPAPTDNGERDDTAADSEAESGGAVRHEVAAMRERLEGEALVDEESLLSAEETATLPFDIRLRRVELAGAAGLHSFAAAVVESGPDRGKWLLVGGRTNGLHNLVGTSFPTPERNTDFWVIDPAGEACSAPMNGLLQNLYDALAATNHQSVQVGDVLWVNGGYGWSVNAQDNVTFGFLIAIDVPNLVAAVLEHCGREVPNPGQYVSHGSLGPECELFGPKTADGDGCLLTVTGGGIEHTGEELVLALGQRFGGRYNDFRNQQQHYACRFLRFPIPEPVWGSTMTLGPITTIAEGGADCPPGGLVPNDDPFHRRDLNVVPAVYLDRGAPRPAVFAYGGVFRLEFFAFHEPMYATAAGVTVDHGTTQRFSQYEAATVSLHSTRSETLHTVILGGISTRHCVEGQEGVDTPQCTKTRKILSFPGFIEDGTILSCQGGGVTSEGFACRNSSQIFLYRPYLVHNPDLPTGMLGSNAHFFRDPGIAAYPNDVLMLDRLPAGEYTRVGTIYGGIEVSGKVPGQPFLHDKTRSETKASTLAFAVEVKPL